MRLIPSHLPVLCLLAMGARAQDQAARALEQAQQALEHKQFEAAMTHCREYERLKPGSAEAPYTMAVIRWAEAYGPINKAKQGAPEQRLSAEQKNSLRQRFSASLAEGHADLRRALTVDPNFADALAYDNLLYRLEAEIAATQMESAALIRKADSRVLEAKAAAAKQPKRKFASSGAPPPPPPPPKR